MSKEKRLPLELDLEESGTLCHLLLRGLMDQYGDREVVAVLSDGKTKDPVLARYLRFYQRLAAVNDKLMGKD